MKLNSLKSAFSLVELSIVVLIMGATTASLVGANNMMKKSRLVKAKSETSSSPVKNMNGLILWYEATMEASTNAATNGSNISVWNDLSPNKTNATQATSGNQPQYIDSAINKLPAIRFDGSNDLMNFTGGAIASNNYTIIIVEQRKDSKSNNYFLNGTGSGLSNDNLYLGYSDNSHIIHGQTNNYYTINTASYGFFSTPKIHIFTHNSNSGKKYYQNTSSLGSGTETPPKALTSYTGSIGGSSSGYYYGDIGEIIVFNRTLSDSERKSIESYLAKKWYVNIQPGSTPANTNSCTVSLAGTSVTSVNNAGSSLTCDVAGYTGSVTYTCSGGSFNSGACTPITCSASGAGYSRSGLAYGNSSFSCNNSGYTGTIYYNCSGTSNPGTFNYSSGSCTLNNCNFNNFPGINNTTVGYAPSWTSKNCDAQGYSGSISYTCIGGALSTSGSCTTLPWTVCRNSGGTAWISANSSGGTFNATSICQSLGFSGVEAYGGTSGSVCVSESFDSQNSGTSLSNLSSTVHWRCGNSGTCNFNGRSGTIISYSGSNYCNLGRYTILSPSTIATYTCKEACASVFGTLAGTTTSSYTCGRSGVPDGLVWLSTSGGASGTAGCWGNMSDNGKQCSFMSDGNSSTTCTTAFSASSWSGGQMNSWSSRLGCNSDLDGNICYKIW